MQLIGFQRVNEKGSRKIEIYKEGKSICVCGGGRRRKEMARGRTS